MLHVYNIDLFIFYFNEDKVSIKIKCRKRNRGNIPGKKATTKQQNIMINDKI